MLHRKARIEEHGHYSVNEEKLNAYTHFAGLILSIIGLIALFGKSQGSAQILVSVVYGLSLSMMFLSSSIYHSSSNPKRRVILRKVDHIAIYVLIAGTYTPFLILGVGGNLGLYGTLVVWLIGVSGIVFKLTLGHRFPKVSIATYALMGWLVLFLIYPIYNALSATGFGLLLAGGLAYTLGIPFYMLKSRHYSHAIWHIFVVLGAALHFFSIYLTLL